VFVQLHAVRPWCSLRRTMKPTSDSSQLRRARTGEQQAQRRSESRVSLVSQRSPVSSISDCLSDSESTPKVDSKANASLSLSCSSASRTCPTVGHEPSGPIARSIASSRIRWPLGVDFNCQSGGNSSLGQSDSSPTAESRELCIVPFASGNDQLGR